jgi:hypothetical protein
VTNRALLLPSINLVTTMIELYEMKVADKRGDSKLGCLIWLVIFVLALFAGYKFGAAQWAYVSFKEELFEIAKSASRERSIDEGVYYHEIMRRAGNLGISINPEDIRITESENEVTIAVDWVTEFDFFGYIYSKDYSVTVSHKKGL